MSKNLNAEIVAVGTELLLGQIANTNAQWLAQQLALIGVNTYYQTVVGDNISRMKQTFEIAHGRSNIIIVTGGLGPTEDDATREAFSEMSELPIVTHQETLLKIKQYFEKSNAPMPPSNLKQAHTFKGATVVPNEVGIACGSIVHFAERTWIFLPGVPREMKQMYTREVMSFLKSLNGEMIIDSTVLRFIGIGESQIEHELKQLFEKQTNPTIAPLALADGVTLRLTAKAKTKREVNMLLHDTKAKILNKYERYYYGENNETIEEKIFQLLKAQDEKLAVAESITGGLFTHKLVNVSGVSSVLKGGIICYDTSVKENVLHIDRSLLEQYGTVSEQCALAMAKNVAEQLNATIGISFTGIAGPNEIENKRVGTVYIGFYCENNTEKVERYLFQGDRKQIRYRAMLKGYELLFKHLNS